MHVYAKRQAVIDVGHQKGCKGGDIFFHSILESLAWEPEVAHETKCNLAIPYKSSRPHV